MGVVNQPVEHAIAKCVVTDHVVPVFDRPPAGYSVWRFSLSVAPATPLSVVTHRIP